MGLSQTLDIVGEFAGGSQLSPTRAHAPEVSKITPAAGCSTGDACGCSGGVPVFDGVDPRYKRVLWTVIALNATMFLVEMVMGSRRVPSTS